MITPASHRIQTGTICMNVITAETIVAIDNTAAIDSVRVGCQR